MYLDHDAVDISSVINKFAGEESEVYLTIFIHQL